MTFKEKHHSEGASRKSTTADAGSGIPRRQSERSGNAGRINMAHMKRPIPPKGKKHGFTDPRYTHGTSWELACALEHRGLIHESGIRLRRDFNFRQACNLNALPGMNWCLMPRPRGIAVGRDSSWRPWL